MVHWYFQELVSLLVMPSTTWEHGRCHLVGAVPVSCHPRWDGVSGGFTFAAQVVDIGK